MTNEITRPLLAGTIDDVSKIVYPIIATPKLDGIRVLKINGKIVTRKFKEFPNTYVRETLESILPDGIDGEILLQPGDSFNEIQSQLMSYDGEPNFTFHAFDYVKDNLDKPYSERQNDLQEWFTTNISKICRSKWMLKIFLVMPATINSETELLQYETKCLKNGYEGVMVRTPMGRYKCGRSTLKEGILLKLKRFKDAEAEVIGFEEKLKNTNKQEEDEFGLSKRSSKKDGLVPADTLGALMVRDLKTNVQFSIGSGFDDSQRKDIWENTGTYLGKIVKYKFQEIGQKDLPRFPVFLGFRSKLDL